MSNGGMRSVKEMCPHLKKRHARQCRLWADYYLYGSYITISLDFTRRELAPRKNEQLKRFLREKGEGQRCRCCVKKRREIMWW